MKLNLGSGTKLMEGYINVDLHPGADLLCDMCELPKEWEGKIEEIVVNHAFEHLPYFKTGRALIEWWRVLKPGGKLIIECPNLAEACKAYLLDPNNMTKGLGALYGPQWEREDELMVHKSGWTPSMLVHLLEKAGYTEAKQTPAQFHKREPRDFRVEAIK